MAPHNARTPLRILLIEDSMRDAELLELALLRAGFDPVYRQVDEVDGMLAALHEESWDIVIADGHLPRFTGLDALRSLKQSGYSIPFILVSGTMVAETAEEALREGAHEYIVKDELERLGPAIERVLGARTCSG